MVRVCLQNIIGTRTFILTCYSHSHMPRKRMKTLTIENEKRVYTPPGYLCLHFKNIPELEGGFLWRNSPAHIGGNSTKGVPRKYEYLWQCLGPRRNCRPKGQLPRGGCLKYNSTETDKERGNHTLKGLCTNCGKRSRLTKWIIICGWYGSLGNARRMADDMNFCHQYLVDSLGETNWTKGQTYAYYDWPKWPEDFRPDKVWSE